MIRNISTNNRRGFSLIELSIVLGVIAILAGSITPVFIKRVQIKAGEKTAMEMSVIQEAARAYYVANKAWPASIAALQSGGYLNASWVTNNPWGNVYNASSTASTYTVSTSVTSEWVNLVARDLPSATISGSTVSSTIPIPGSASNPSIPSGLIVMWSGTVAAVPSGWALCDGSNGTPDLRDKFVVGARQDSGGQAMTSITGSLTKSGGSTLISIVNLPSHNHGLSNGSTSSTGAHMHTFPEWATASGSGPRILAALDYLGSTVNTGSAGAHTHSLSGNTDNTGSSTVYTQPYYALCFIMKT